MNSSGTVREWDDARGFGVIDSADTPGGCWSHFSAIVADGYRGLQAGDHATFTFEEVSQDGFSYRAALVWPPGVAPGTSPQTSSQDSSGSAYQGKLTIRWRDGTVTHGLPETKHDQ